MELDDSVSDLEREVDQEVRTSLAKHPLTVMTLFVNPMQVCLSSRPFPLQRTRSQDQFAPTEDLSKYPRTLAKDLELLFTLLPPPAQSEAQEHVSEKKVESPLVIFNPPEEVMYPLRGNLQDLSKKRGVEVDVKGWGDVMEGASRRGSISYHSGSGTGLGLALMI